MFAKLKKLGIETKFVALTGFLRGPNLINAFGKIEQARYVDLEIGILTSVDT